MTETERPKTFTELMRDSWILRDRFLGFFLYLESVGVFLVSIVILAAAVDLTLRGFYAEGLLAVLFAGMMVLIGTVFKRFGDFVFKNAREYRAKEEPTRLRTEEEKWLDGRM